MCNFVISRFQVVSHIFDKMGEPGSVDEPLSFRRIKKKPKALRPQAKEEQKKEPSRGDDEDEETEIR